MSIKFGPTPEQAQVIDSWGEGLAVMAGAGCGKTTTLVNKCAALLERRPDNLAKAGNLDQRSPRRYAHRCSAFVFH